MKKWLYVLLLAAILVERAFSVPAAAAVTESSDDDYDDGDEDDDSSEADDDGRVYKNPRNSPSSECPRDEEQATLLGQKCLRKCSSDEDCKSKKKKCLCDGACGMSCIKPDRECVELPKPELGDVAYSSRLFGSRATYTCPHGYHVVGLQSRLCLADGNWAGTEPACKQNIYCLTPPTIDHARHSALPEQATFDLDSTVQYHCHTGYVTNGFNRAKCLAIDGQASWYGPDISCEPRSCGQPQDPGNGYHAGECYTFGCRITYHCGEGYELVGKQERFCQADGSWTPKETPTCVLVTAVQCPAPENPKNGKAIYTSCSYNSVVSYECRYGYTLVGESSRRCGADKKWSGQLPSCKEINCAHPGVLYNGWLENTEGGYGLGASIIFRCQAGMLLYGHSSTVCQIDGKWRYPVPQCLAPCVVPTISQGIVIPIEGEFDYNTTTVAPPGLATVSKVQHVQHGTTLEIVCDEHYEFPLASLTPPTCNNGTWSVIPRCVPARCKSMPKYPKNGMVIAPKTEHGMKARFKCKDGFNLTGPGGREITDPNEFVLTCSFGNWTGDTPYCQEVYCSFPGYISHGKVFLVGNMGLYDYRPYVKKIVNNKQIMYECDKGYVLDNGPPGATCIGGLWRPTELPQCLLGQHPRLRWNRRRRSAPSSLNFKKQIKEFKSYLNKIADNDLKGIPNSYDDGEMDKYYLSSNDFIMHRPGRGKRDISEMEKAYMKYYQKIKEKYRNYVKNLLGFRLENNRPEEMSRNHLDRLRTASKQDYNENSGNINSFYTDRDSYQGLEENTEQRSSAPIRSPISMPNINERVSTNKATKKLGNGYEQNYEYLEPYYTEAQNNYEHKYRQQKSTKPPDLADIIAQLKSQTVRKRRRRDTEPESSNPQIDDLANGNGNRKARTKIPCEALVRESYLSFEIVREGKNKEEEFSAGTIVKVSCPSELFLNLPNPNGTAKCVRGRWKPMKPACLTEPFKKPCVVPAVNHGKYHAFSADPITHSKSTSIHLNNYDTVQSGELIAFQCESGFNVQGHANMGCYDGQWSVTSFPECIAIPCILPDIPGASYLGGYRSTLTIGSGSSVSVLCDNSPPTSAINLDCHLGELVPISISCHNSRKSREDPLGPTVANITEPPDHLDLFTTPYPTEMSLMIDEKGCGPPARIDGSLVYRNGEPVTTIDNSFPVGTEITFNCISSIQGERSTWKIICEDGSWIGRSLSCANTSCIFRNNEPNLASFYNDLEIREEVVEFPPGATVVSRCVDIGKYTLVGSNTRSCIHSEWSGQKPVCFGLNQENDYAMEKSPTILFRHQNGPIAQSNDGKLMVFPGTTLHMECLWMRRFGNPKWNVSHEYRKYPEGWVTDENRDSTLEYRLSIFHAVEDDSGIFSCQTPARHEHSIDVVVKAINCAEIPSRRGLTLSTTDTKMSTKVILSCANGNSLIGASEITCLPSGNWSAPLPVCESKDLLATKNHTYDTIPNRTAHDHGFLKGVECGDIPLLTSNNGTAPRVSVLSREVGGRVAFSCSNGYGLRGPSESVCLPSGEWSAPFPTCIDLEVQCENPGAPLNGYAQGSAPYRAGDVVQFNCNPEYMMQGQPIIACQDSGRWSGGLPKCVQACSYPGTTISGRMSSVKFYYAIGENITFTCDPGLMLKGAKMLKCMRNGKWSNAIPTCVSSTEN